MSYSRLPKDTNAHKDWILITGRPVDNFPSKIFLCSDHFEEKYFDPSWKLQNEIYYKDHQINRRFSLGSTPILLLHKKDEKPRLSSENRALTEKRKR